MKLALAILGALCAFVVILGVDTALLPVTLLAIGVILVAAAVVAP